MANRPIFYTLIDRNASNINALYDESPLNLTGFQSDQVIPSTVHNTLWLIDGLWQSYMDYNTLRTSDFVASGVSQLWAGARLAYFVGASVIAGAGAGVTSYPTYYFGDYRIEIDSFLLKPAAAGPLLLPLATTPGRIWVYVSTNAIVDPLQPFAVVRTESVGVGVVETPGPNELALVGVDIDVTGVVTGNSYPAVEPTPELVYGTLAQRWTSTVEYDGTAQFNSSSQFDDVATFTSSVIITSGALVSLDASNNSATPTVMIANAGGAGAQISGVSASYALTVENTGAGPSAVVKKNVAGVGLQADSTVGGGTAIEVLGGALGVDASSSSGSAIKATTATGIGVNAISTSSGDAIVAVGGPSAVSNAGTFTAAHLNASAIVAATDGAAATSAYAVSGQAFNDGVGVRGLGADGYGVVAQSDTTLPNSAAMRLVPQNADPVIGAQGALMFNTSISGFSLGKLRVFTSLWESVHATAKGYTFTFGSVASGGPVAGGSGNLSLIGISPEQTGSVLLTMTGSFEFSSDTAQCTLSIVDATSALTVATQTERAADLDGAGVNTRSVVIRGVRVLPSTVFRQFYAQFTMSSGTITYANVVLSCQGVQ